MRSPTRRAVVAFVAMALLGLAVVVFGWRSARARKEAEAPPPGASRGDEIIPRTAQAIAIDGELDEQAWFGALRSQAFVAADGISRARPHSEARLLVTGSTLHVALYAADDDIQASVKEADGPLWLGDAFQLGFRHGADTWRIDVSPRGTVSDAHGASGGTLDYAWSSAARTAFDVDGTIDDPTDRDEEWLIEMAIPLASMGWTGKPGERIELFMKRCDMPRDASRTCGTWGTEQKPIVLTLGGGS